MKPIEVEGIVTRLSHEFPEVAVVDCLGVPARQIRRLLPTPGVTAAATTAVFATGAPRPGVTAAATTAVLATGAPMTPTLPTRPGLMGISNSYRGSGSGFVGLDGGDDRLNGYPSVGDELATRLSGG